MCLVFLMAKLLYGLGWDGRVRGYGHIAVPRPVLGWYGPVESTDLNGAASGGKREGIMGDVVRQDGRNDDR